MSHLVHTVPSYQNYVKTRLDIGAVTQKQYMRVVMKEFFALPPEGFSKDQNLSSVLIDSNKTISS